MQRKAIDELTDQLTAISVQAENVERWFEQHESTNNIFEKTRRQISATQALLDCYRHALRPTPRSLS